MELGTMNDRIEEISLSHAPGIDINRDIVVTTEVHTSYSRLQDLELVESNSSCSADECVVCTTYFDE